METLKLLKEKKEQEKKDSISFSLPLEMIKRIKRLAEANGINNSDIAEYALKEFLNSLGPANGAEVYAQHTPSHTH